MSFITCTCDEWESLFVPKFLMRGVKTTHGFVCTYDFLKWTNHEMCAQYVLETKYSVVVTALFLFRSSVKRTSSKVNTVNTSLSQRCVYSVDLGRCTFHTGSE